MTGVPFALAVAITRSVKFCCMTVKVIQDGGLQDGGLQNGKLVGCGRLGAGGQT